MSVDDIKGSVWMDIAPENVNPDNLNKAVKLLCYESPGRIVRWGWSYLETWQCFRLWASWV